MTPQIHTYHCVCTSLLLASTHSLSSLPRRSSDAGSIDAAHILPQSATSDLLNKADLHQKLPLEGYTMLLGLDKDTKKIIIRRNDGFEKRILYRCSRCRIVVGYEVLRQCENLKFENEDSSHNQVLDPLDSCRGKTIYLIPGGIMSTSVMTSKKKLEEEDVQIFKTTTSVFEET